MLFILSNFREYLIALMAISLFIAYQIIQSKDKDIKVLKDNIASLTYITNQQNAYLEKQKKEYEIKLKQLPKEIVKIKTKYEVIYKNIEASRGDKNASCEDNINTINHFAF